MKGRILYSSPSVERVLGSSQGERVGQSIFEGRIEVESALGKGAAFRVLLPTTAS